MKIRATGIGFLMVCCITRAAGAVTYQVGPSAHYTEINDVMDLLRPGDIVEVQGDHTYAGDLWFRDDQNGEDDNPVTVRGVRVNGRRPVVAGVGTEQWHDMVILLAASHFVFEGFEIVGDGNEEHSCIVHKADDVVIRDVVVHGCGRHGLLGTDDDSGSLSLEYSEFYNNGGGLYYHQIYMATDESIYPGAVFRMQYCYVHDAAGGNSVKSRAERNEIYFNWIEGALYHELDLIGPDTSDPEPIREDSDVVGNVLVKTSEWQIARIGGDGTGNTAGRYRFVNNTMILGPEADLAFRLQETVETFEAYNNILYSTGGNAAVYRLTEPSGPDVVIVGQNNWVQNGWTDIPSEWTGTLKGSDPGFVSLADWDLRPTDGSPLIDTGTENTTMEGDSAFVSPLVDVHFQPTARALTVAGSPLLRPVDAKVDIGAYEYGSDAVVPACLQELTLCNGECVDIYSDPANCGGCEDTCQSNQFCSLGECTDACDELLVACGQACVNTETNVQHCGECHHVCSLANAISSCMNSECVIDYCNPGFVDANGTADDGCESACEGDNCATDDGSKVSDGGQDADKDNGNDGGCGCNAIGGISAGDHLVALIAMGIEIGQ